jgi:cold shock CspA family protein
MTTTRRLGKCTVWSKRAYGFICDDETRESFFVHITKVRGKRELRSGDHVTFEVADDPRSRARKMAVDVEIWHADIIEKDGTDEQIHK